MMFEYTLLTTLAFHHMIIGGLLIAALLLLNKFISLSAESQSWLWMTAFVISTAIPFTLLSNNETTRNIAIDSPGSTLLLTPSTNSISINDQTILPTNSSWHLPSELVFNFSLFLSLGMVLWLVGSVWRATTVLSTVSRTRQLLHSQRTPIDSLSSTFGIKVYSSTLVASPMVVGFWTPKIILPQSILEELRDEQLDAVVLHEKAHIQRRDNWFSLFQELLVIIFWWSPILRFLNRKIHVEREIACDLRAVSQMQDSKQYAQSLVDCAKLMVDEKRNVLAMGLFSKKKELNYRVGAVLKNKAKKIPNIGLVVAICLAFSATALGAAQIFSPKISIKHTADDARFYSTLSKRRGEKLLKAVKANDIGAIQALLDDGVNINTPVIGDGTALMIAVKRRNASMTQALIELGADVNQASMFDGNPLIIAAKTNNLALAQLLIDHGADVNGYVRRDETPLINATTRGHLDMTRLLVEHGANVNLSITTGIEDGFEIRSPLNRATNDKVRQYLITNGAIE